MAGRRKRYLWDSGYSISERTLRWRKRARIENFINVSDSSSGLSNHDTGSDGSPLSDSDPPDSEHSNGDVEMQAEIQNENFQGLPSASTINDYPGDSDQEHHENTDNISEDNDSSLAVSDNSESLDDNDDDDDESLLSEYMSVDNSSSSDGGDEEDVSDDDEDLAVTDDSDGDDESLLSEYMSIDNSSSSDGGNLSLSEDVSDDEEIGSVDGTDSEDTDSGREQEEGEAPEEEVFVDLLQTMTLRTDVTVGQAVTLILAWALRHTATTKYALRDLLLVLHTLVGPSRLPKSLYYFEKYFKDLKGKVELHYYCYSCLKGLGRKPEDVCGDCGKRRTIEIRRSEGNFYIVMPLKAQIRKLLQRREIASELNYRSEREKKHPDNLEDIYDGEIYKSIPELIDQKNISLTWNTDGVQCSKSSKFSIWPIQAIVNELPPNVRRKNILLCGIWFGEDKPIRDLFYEFFVKECNDLETNGVFWRDEEGNMNNSKVYNLVCTCDSPARALLMNQKQYNGTYGCAWCVHPGVHVPKGRGYAHVYPYQVVPSSLRTEKETIRNAEAAVRGRKPVKGVKGPSVLMKLNKMDCIKSYSVDYLHADLSGVTKATMNLWLDPKHRGHAYYIGRRRQTERLNGRLMDIKPPNLMPRVPRPVQTRNRWKAKEFMFFLLHYSLPCLLDILPRRYFDHWMLLVTALGIFLSNSISPYDFQRASQMLLKFVRQYSRLYGVQEMTSNVHSLLHVPECVKNMGPLWASSTFIFESNNNSLVKMAHGTQEIPLQIARGFTLRQHLPNMYLKHIRGTRLNDLYQRITSNYHSVNSHLLEMGIRRYGASSMRHPSPEEAQALETLLPFPVPDKIEVFSRVSVFGVMYHSRNYRKARKRISYFVKLRNSRYILVIDYCYVRGKAYALCKQALLSRNKIGLDRETGACAEKIHLIDDFTEMRAVEVRTFADKCVFISRASGKHPRDYCLEIPNTIELD